MKSSNHPFILNLILPVISVLLAVVYTSTAQAELVISFVESGGQVNVFTSGTLNLTDLTQNQGGTSGPPDIAPAFMVPNQSLLLVGSSGVGNYDRYGDQEISGPGSFGIGGGSFPVSATGLGGLVGIRNQGVSGTDGLAVPVGYVSGNSINASSVYSGNFNSLGITRGVYTWTWGAGANADSLILYALPEPSSLAYAFIVGAGLASRSMRRRKKRGRS